MPTDFFGIPLLPVIALLGGILTLVKADILNWVVAVFLIGFGVLGILPAIGVNIGTSIADVQQMLEPVLTTPATPEPAAPAAPATAQ